MLLQLGSACDVDLRVVEKTAFPVSFHWFLITSLYMNEETFSGGRVIAKEKFESKHRFDLNYNFLISIVTNFSGKASL